MLCIAPRGLSTPKRPFGGPEQVYRYLGRYTHRIAISNSRLVSATDDSVAFRTRGDQTASPPPLVFLMRFLQHVLPHGFVKIRHYGLLVSGNVTTRLERARALLGGGGAEPDAQLNEQDSEPDQAWPELLAAVAAVDVILCPSCGAHTLRGPLPSPHPPGARLALDAAHYVARQPTGRAGRWRLDRLSCIQSAAAKIS